MYRAKRKYLLKDSINDLIKDLQLDSIDIIEYYTVVKVCKEVRYSKVGSKYYKTVKSGVVSSYSQKRFEISKKRFKNKRKRAIGDRVVKKEFTIIDNSKAFIIDIYKRELKGLNILEVKFQKSIDFNSFELPELFAYHVIKEITKSERYLNKNLALLGDPKKNLYNIYSIFKDIELARAKSLDKIIFKEMKSSDAIRIMLYKLFIELRVVKDRLTISDKKEDFDRYKAILKESLILLNLYKDIFDKTIFQKVLSNLKMMKRVIKSYDDLEFIEKELSILDDFIGKDEVDRLREIIADKKLSQRRKIARFFTTREFAIIFKQYELLLKENNRSFLTIDAQTSIENSLKHKISIQKRESLMISDKYEGCEDIDSQKAIKKSFNILYILLSKSNIVVKKEKNSELKRAIKSIDKNLKRLDRLHKRRLIITTYLENLSSKPANYKEIINKIHKINKDAIEKNSKSLMKSIEKFTKL